MNSKYAKPFVAILSSKLEWREKILSSLSKVLGKVDFVGPWRSFEHTNYYTPEMGEGLSRCLVSFEKNISMEEVSKLKALTKKVEDQCRVDNKRQVNLDPGYLDLHKVVLVSGKGGGHMLMLTNEVYVDFLLWYQKGWQPLPWTYPDFRAGTYHEELSEIRKIFKGQMIPPRSVTGAR